MIIADNETAVDYLNCEAISKTVVSVLADNRKQAITVGIHGDWGAGKSSVLKMIERDVKPDGAVACIWFNGWTFQGFDDAKTVLIEAIITELMRQRRTMAKVQDLGKELLQRVDFLKLAKRGVGLAINLATGLPSPDQIGAAIGGIKDVIGNLGKASAEDIEAQLTEASSYLRDAKGMTMPDAVDDFRARFEDLLKVAKVEQLIVLIDDLDRCLPETAIETLEAIRLFLFVPGAAFVIGADEGMIEYAVRRHFPDLPAAPTAVPYARNYLEKLIQVPFRIPSLGVQETRTYVMLLLVGSIVKDEADPGFQKLLAKARAALNSPWLAQSLTQADVRAVDGSKQKELDEAFMLATQLGPILAEGAYGNPRQIKRFLNALLIRRAIAEARGLETQINQAALGRLMLMERFQPDFYEHIARSAMASGDGKVGELAELEAAAAPRLETKGRKVKGAKDDAEDSKWLERDQIRLWLQIEPALGGEDLRPYVFVARERRLTGIGQSSNDTEQLIGLLSNGGQMVVRGLEPRVRLLAQSDANVIFGALRERVVQEPNLSSIPEAIHGLRVVAKHHGHLQSELVALLATLDAKKLGMWAVSGWSEFITENAAQKQLTEVVRSWAGQDANALLKRTAGQAIATGKAS
ncbi:hypothetical protein ASC89_22090 [Devosia sp. Root413D1]|uniref:Qat anti-phage system ATPase QatA n=1 Tax=Devosia sp. Root413D1 TaxID=1736531 RepID=UPI0006FE86F1|nr:Qat anti-phage system ATPase QatA [Devosia sp. Root413D1]KQW75630.1 hypothetical protein ASC89_22090 [Devosia sp. Root413D1]